jgi:hypothetical protein
VPQDHATYDLTRRSEDALSMSERQVNGPAEPQLQSSEIQANTEKRAPTFICEYCGPEKPVAQVFPCTLCNMNFCVEHLALKHHYCIGALGKPQVP